MYQETSKVLDHITIYVPRQHRLTRPRPGTLKGATTPHHATILNQNLYTGLGQAFVAIRANHHAGISNLLLDLQHDFHLAEALAVRTPLASQSCLLWSTAWACKVAPPRPDVRHAVVVGQLCRVHGLVGIRRVRCQLRRHAFHNLSVGRGDVASLAWVGNEIKQTRVLLRADIARVFDGRVVDARAPIWDVRAVWGVKDSRLGAMWQTRTGARHN